MWDSAEASRRAETLVNTKELDAASAIGTAGRASAETEGEAATDSVAMPEGTKVRVSKRTLPFESNASVARKSSAQVRPLICFSRARLPEDTRSSRS